jgi:hypothetical protein
MPVEERILSSSIEKPGRLRGLEPVASIMALARTRLCSPSFSTSRLRDSFRLPWPGNKLDLVFSEQILNALGKSFGRHARSLPHTAEVEARGID